MQINESKYKEIENKLKIVEEKISEALKLNLKDEVKQELITELKLIKEEINLVKKVIDNTF